MSIEVTVPRLGWSMEEGSFCRWLKADGEMVREGDGLFELEGDKATQVIESFDAGILRIPVDGPKPGDAVKVGQVLATLEPRAGKRSGGKLQPGEKLATNGHTAAEPPASAPKRHQEPAAQQPLLSKVVSPPTGVALASPSVRRLARELGVDLQAVCRGAFPVSASDLLQSITSKVTGASAAFSHGTRPTRRERAITPRARRVAADLRVDTSQIHGSGRNGRVRERDVREAATSPASPPRLHEPLPTDPVGDPIPQLRRVIAQRMMAASHDTAPVTLNARADASELVRFRDQCKQTSAEGGPKAPSYTELIVKLCAAALQQHPVLLDQWIDERMIRPTGVHIAVAVATANGLVTPVIRDVPALSLRDLSSRFGELIELARAQRLTLEQMRGGAFTVSSLGGYRVEAFTPILNPPQTAILGVGQISEQPVVRDGSLTVSHVVTLSLTFDHRVVDGAPSAAFLTALCGMVENPLGWLLA